MNVSLWQILGDWAWNANVECVACPSPHHPSQPTPPTLYSCMYWSCRPPQYPCPLPPPSLLTTSWYYLPHVFPPARYRTPQTCKQDICSISIVYLSWIQPDRYKVVSDMLRREDRDISSSLFYVILYWPNRFLQYCNISKAFNTFFLIIKLSRMAYGIEIYYCFHNQHQLKTF